MARPSAPTPGSIRRVHALRYRSSQRPRANPALRPTGTAQSPRGTTASTQLRSTDRPRANASRSAPAAARRPAARKTAPRARSRAAFGRDICAECGSSSQDDDDSAGAGSGAGVSMIGGGGGGAGTAAESAATCTAVVRLISSFRSFQEATLPAAKPSAQAERRAPMLAILVVAKHSEFLQEQFCTSNYRPSWTSG